MQRGYLQSTLARGWVLVGSVGAFIGIWHLTLAEPQRITDLHSFRGRDRR